MLLRRPWGTWEPETHRIPAEPESPGPTFSHKAPSFRLQRSFFVIPDAALFFRHSGPDALLSSFRTQRSSFVIPDAAQRRSGIQCPRSLDSRLRGNDEGWISPGGVTTRRLPAGKTLPLPCLHQLPQHRGGIAPRPQPEPEQQLVPLQRPFQPLHRATAALLISSFRTRRSSFVIPDAAQRRSGIQCPRSLDSRLRGNDEGWISPGGLRQGGSRRERHCRYPVSTSSRSTEVA